MSTEIALPTEAVVLRLSITAADRISKLIAAARHRRGKSMVNVQDTARRERFFCGLLPQKRRGSLLAVFVLGC